jgi:hypothetical protein
LDSLYCTGVNKFVKKDSFCLEFCEKYFGIRFEIK